jgi:hypothetical protein
MEYQSVDRFGMTTIPFARLSHNCCAQIKFEQEEYAIGNAGNSKKSVHNDREGRQQRISERRIKIVVSGLPLGHESSKISEFSAEWTVNKNKQAAGIKWDITTVAVSPINTCRSLKGECHEHCRSAAAAKIERTD